MRTREHDRLDEEDRVMSEIEDMLEEDVRFFWAKTRQGPHDDCDCYWFYQRELAWAVKRLRAFRAGAYWDR